jgi:hypothetical protein
MLRVAHGRSGPSVIASASREPRRTARHAEFCPPHFPHRRREANLQALGIGQPRSVMSAA